MVGILLLLFASAAITEWLGLHALIGAFLAGAILPRNHALAQQIESRLDVVTNIILLPIFFASVGMRADLSSIRDAASWSVAALLLTIAVIGKFGGTTLAARNTGMHWRLALGLGALLNTRGLIALVVATIGLDIGVISPTLFTILALIAIITTCMTGPLLRILRVSATRE